MISFNGIGDNGRLGNQMFQYAALRGIAEYHGYDWTVPPASKQSRDDYGLFRYFKMEDAQARQGRTTFPFLHVAAFHWDESFMKSCPDNVDIGGYFQTEKYFKHIESKIRKDFTFKDTLGFPQSNEYTVVHVRRGDYVRQPEYHPTCSLEYYKKAMEMVDGPFLVISDDIEWCKENIDADAYSNRSTIQDLYSMSVAKNNIIANSSFSWWGAWLNTNAGTKTIAPERWFGPAYSHLKMYDLRPAEWIQI